MESNDGKGPGDSSTPRKKRAPSARKRTPKAVKAAQQTEPPTTDRELAPQAEAQPAQTEPREEADRSAVEPRSPGQRTSQERVVPLDGQGDESFGVRDADRAADVAADLKSWMDTRREDRDAPREVL